MERELDDVRKEESEEGRSRGCSEQDSNMKWRERRVKSEERR